MKNVTRRTVLSLSAAGAAAAFLSACGGPSTSGGGSSAAPTAASLEGVKPASEIQFWSNHPGQSSEIEKSIIAAFEKANPGIKVKLITAGKNYEEVYQKFNTAYASGNAGDVVVASDATWFKYFLNKQIIPLDDLFASQKFDVEDFRTALLEDYNYKGKHYGVPYSRSTPVFYYNKDHFKAAGLPDRAPKTWQELAEWAPKLKAASTKAQQVFTVPDAESYNAWTLQNVIWGYGGGFSKDGDFALTKSPETKEAVSFLQKAIHGDKWAAIGSGEPADLFTSGATSTVVASTGSLKGILSAATFNVGVGFLPGGPKETDKIVPTGGAGVAINAKASPERQLAAAMFIKFLTNAENAAAFSKATGYLPTRTSADMKDAIQATPQLKIAIDQLEKTRPQDDARVFLPGGDLELAKALQGMLTADSDPQPNLDALSTKLEGIYNKELKPRLG
ncbi:ABC transporter substrate-binding protein [Falsarthrobacter nasiphocae]|uniref:Sn-glycerol 3-phosphate transport system substrate-binding protein n=1 Tax=Falsarthrobacter nasiphocae TaxID=189863 RepID=A0AAE3YIA7_9MICC|nr:ABC transporter substrate-binding protein [Falsarthrobacter nasiphocae]MDR6892541.1 sn-glycerol 3-phosphate transport system substrate-binding protein [Falsarthrobacter nasiphocae]